MHVIAGERCFPFGQAAFATSAKSPAIITARRTRSAGNAASRAHRPSGLRARPGVALRRAAPTERAARARLPVPSGTGAPPASLVLPERHSARPERDRVRGQRCRLSRGGSSLPATKHSRRRSVLAASHPRDTPRRDGFPSARAGATDRLQGDLGSPLGRLRDPS